jgi:hypothetical protein
MLSLPRRLPSRRWISSRKAAIKDAMRLMNVDARPAFAASELLIDRFNDLNRLCRKFNGVVKDHALVALVD